MPGRGAAPVPAAFSLIGAGRMGTALALALAAAGSKPLWIAGRSPGSRRRARALLGGGRCTADPVKAAAGAPLVLLGVPDDPLEGLVRALAGSGAVARGSLWIHLSGFHGLEPLSPVEAAGGRAAALHPLQTVSDPATGPERLAGALFTVVARDPEWPLARRIVAAVGGKARRMPAEGRVLYHAAAVLACNDMVALFSLAARLLAKATGAALEGRALLGLLRSTLAGLEQAGPEAALTGPVVRGDVGVVRAHLEALARRAPWALPAYRVLGLEALALARRRRGARYPGADALGRILGEQRGRAAGGRGT